jgi:hypothetical protein
MPPYSWQKIVATRLSEMLVYGVISQEIYENGDGIFHENAGNHLPNHMASVMSDPQYFCCYIYLSFI